MILYVETNFVLELAFLQEDHEHCEEIIELAEGRAGGLQLVIPAFSVGEAYHRQIRQEAERSALQGRIINALDDISRTRPYAERSMELREVTSFLEESNREDRGRLDSVLKTLLSAAGVIPTTGAVIAEAFDLQRSRGLSPPDALVYASVLSHLRSAAPQGAQGAQASCFVTRDRHFADDDIRADLEALGCKLLFKFEDAQGYVRSRLT